MLMNYSNSCVLMNHSNAAHAYACCNLHRAQVPLRPLHAAWERGFCAYVCDRECERSSTSTYTAEDPPFRRFEPLAFLYSCKCGGRTIAVAKIRAFQRLPDVFLTSPNTPDLSDFRKVWARGYCSIASYLQAKVFEVASPTIP